MREQEWLTAMKVEPMLGCLHLRRAPSNRKLRLFACACVRRVWHLLGESSRKAVEVAEQYVDGEANTEQLQLAYAAANHVLSGRYPLSQADYPPYAARAAASVQPWEVSHAPWRAVEAGVYGAFCRVVAAGGRRLPTNLKAGEEAAQAALLRDLFGNPFRPVALDAGCLTPTVASLAQAAYDERQLPAGQLDSARLAVLADALEEAGCTNADILGHLHGPGLHIRGCWPVDLVTARQ